MIKKTQKEAKLWMYAAWTLPFVALAVLIGEILIGHETLLGATSIAVAVTFVATSVFWWWWAITKIVYMIKSSDNVIRDFETIKHELREIKKDVGNRQWRESDFDQD